MGLLKKIQRLKRGLMALICINILVLGTSLFATYNYYSSKHDLEVRWSEEQDRLTELQKLESEVARLTIAKPKNSEETYVHRRDSEKLADNLKKINIVDAKPDLVLSKLNIRKQEIQATVQQLISKSMKASQQAAVVGLLTFIFGIVLPLLISYFLTKTLLEAKKSYEEMVAQWIAKYLQEWRTAGDQPFQDPFFWMNLVITTVEIFGPQSKHPAMQILSEFAPVIKREINKRAS